MYRSTPHSVTGTSPAELLFHRRIRDKLPTLKEREEQTITRDRDAYKKGQRQSTNSAPFKSIQCGDEVLVKQPFTKKKSDSKFLLETAEVVAVEGPEITICQPDGKRVSKHKNQVEKFERRENVERPKNADHHENIANQQESEAPHSKAENVDCGVDVSAPTAEHSESDESNGLRRSTRTRNTPSFLCDYVCN